ncbi:hypothetical protein [Magnetospira sp. QH-2]|uniref:hypothetical protein n=1 Tax=Magnetospira sp. (strain QH-2) TaxID=1288970 RepID=UPI0003E8137F|nr:hypothetical protein [Magnetospira sp. QH-2]CCQ74706.1 protein of unknown function [Magnetospira sp. QH-2]
MGKPIAVSKAARMMGVSRSDLNKRLLAAGIPTFEGHVDLERVKCIAPSLDMADSLMVERVAHIRANPSKGINDNKTLPSQRELADDVRHLTTEVMVANNQAARYRMLLDEVAGKLGELQTSESGDRRDMAFELCAWLRGRIDGN